MFDILFFPVSVTWPSKLGRYEESTDSPVWGLFVYFRLRRMTLFHDVIPERFTTALNSFISEFFWNVVLYFCCFKAGKQCKLFTYLCPVNVRVLELWLFLYIRMIIVWWWFSCSFTRGLLLLLYVSNKRALHARGHLRSFTILLHGTQLLEIW